MLTNPDGTYSTKRVAGWMCLFITLTGLIIFLFRDEELPYAFDYLMYLTGGFWGFTSIDNFVQRKSNGNSFKNPLDDGGVDLK